MDTFIIRNTTASGTSQPVPSGSSVQNKKTSGNRSFSTDFIKFGFRRYENNKMVQPQCVVCGEILANESLKPSKLKRHLDTKHPNVKNKPTEYFERLNDQFKSSTNSMKTYCHATVSAVKASYLLAYRIAKNNKPHTIGENLILPAAIDMCTEILGKEAANKLKTIPASNNTVQRRIVDISENIKQQLLNRLSSKPIFLFSIQLDESTDVQNKAILSVFIRYYYEENIHEDFLYCNSLSTTTTGEDIYSSLDNFFIENNIQWTNCVGVTTDGAASMTGKHVGVVRRIKEVAPDAEWTHCMLHREALVSKKMSTDLNKVLSESVKIINFIKSGALNSRLFYKLCEENEQNVKSLLLHSEVRWLSRGKCLFRLFQLRHEVLEFLNNKNSDLKNYFCDSKWLIKLAYLVDIFTMLNNLNLSMQGKNFDIFDQSKKIASFKKKIIIYKKKVEVGNIDMFFVLSEFLEEDDSVNVNDIKTIISLHLNQISIALNSYFPKDIRDDFKWIENPFTVSIEELNFNTLIETQIIDLSCDKTYEHKFKNETLVDFWCAVYNEYPELSINAIKKLLLFPTTYLCEKGFSTMANIKTKQRNRLDVTHDMRISLSEIVPQWEILCNSVQNQNSH